MDAIGEIGKDKAVEILVNLYHSAISDYSNYCVGYSDADDLPQAEELMNERIELIKSILKKMGRLDSLEA